MTAEGYASTLVPGDAVRWRALEVQAFLDYPRVLKVLDPSRKYHSKAEVGNKAVRAVGTAAKNTLTVIGVLLFILGIVVFVFPVAIGLTVLVGGRFAQAPIPVDVALPIAGIIFAYQLVALLISFVLWVRGGKQKDAFRETQAGAGAIFGVVSCIVAVVRDATASVPVWPGWAIIILVSTAFAIVFTVMLLNARAEARREPASTKSTGAKGGAGANGVSGAAVEPLKLVRLEVEKLPDTDQAAIRADLSAAIDDLRTRGVISDRDAEWAQGADLGKLALRMSQPRPKKPVAE